MTVSYIALGGNLINAWNLFFFLFFQRKARKNIFLKEFPQLCLWGCICSCNYACRGLTARGMMWWDVAVQGPLFKKAIAILSGCWRTPAAGFPSSCLAVGVHHVKMRTEVSQRLNLYFRFHLPCNSCVNVQNRTSIVSLCLIIDPRGTHTYKKIKRKHVVMQHLMENKTAVTSLALLSLWSHYHKDGRRWTPAKTGQIL